MFTALKNYVVRLLDADDTSADCLAFGILLGFLGFNALFAIISFVFLAHSFFPQVAFSGKEVAAMVTSLAGSYSVVLSATAAAYRWRTPSEKEKAPV